ncbi:MAG: MazG family protein [Clostridia bacterium]|nr:MazG family protein [Clostridia bacterium]
MITVVGIGIQRGDLGAKGKRAIKEATRVFSRVKVWYKSEILSQKHDDVCSFEQLDEFMANEIISADGENERVVYLSVGDGYTDTVVEKLCKKTDATIIAGVSEYRGRTPGSKVNFVSAYDVKEGDVYDTCVPLVVYGIDDKFIAGNVKIALSATYGDECEVAFSTGKNSVKIALYELDRQKSYNGSALVLTGSDDFINKNRYGISDLIAVMTRLTAPDGCPWDKAQTHESIRTNMLEEAYEVVDAIDKKDIDNMREELGDVLLQVVFHCDMAQRSGEFTLADVVSELVQKLVFRHTHIFGENKASDAESALGFWEEAKAKEKKYHSLSQQLDRFPDTFPSTLRTQKAYKKAVKAGAQFDTNKIADKLKSMIDGGLNQQNAGEFLMLADILASTTGADCETELNKSAAQFIEKIKSADERKTLDRITDEL